jgi:hypothetical protein
MASGFSGMRLRRVSMENLACDLLRSEQVLAGRGPVHPDSGSGEASVGSREPVHSQHPFGCGINVPARGKIRLGGDLCRRGPGGVAAQLGPAKRGHDGGCGRSGISLPVARQVRRERSRSRARMWSLIARTGRTPRIILSTYASNYAVSSTTPVRPKSKKTF